jgi:hypothetical protein
MKSIWPEDRLHHGARIRERGPRDFQRQPLFLGLLFQERELLHHHERQIWQAVLLGEADFGDFGAGLRRYDGEGRDDDERADKRAAHEFPPSSGWSGWFVRIMPGEERNDKEGPTARTEPSFPVTLAGAANARPNCLP